MNEPRRPSRRGRGPGGPGAPMDPNDSADLNPYREDPPRSTGIDGGSEHTGPREAEDSGPMNRSSEPPAPRFADQARPEFPPRDPSHNDDPHDTRQSSRPGGSQRDIAAEAAAAAASILPPLDPVGPNDFTGGPVARPVDTNSYRQPGGGGSGGGGRDFQHGRNGRRHRRGRGRGGQSGGQGAGPRRDTPPPAAFAVTATSETRGWFDPAREGGFIRRAGGSY